MRHKGFAVLDVGGSELMGILIAKCVWLNTASVREKKDKRRKIGILNEAKDRIMGFVTHAENH